MANPVKVIRNLLNAEEEIGEFIAGPNRSGFSGAVQGGYRHRCDEFANLPGWARALSGVAGGSINRICEPYWNARGFSGPQLKPPPFSGGQCSGVAYLVRVTGLSYRLASCNEPDFFDISVDGIGPVEDVSTRLGPGATFPQCVSGGNEVFVKFANRNAIVVGGSSYGGTIQSVTVTRIDGQPDDCGSIPATVEPSPNPPPNPGPLPGPEPTDNPDPQNPIPIIPIPPFDDPVFGPQPVTGPDESTPGSEPTPPAGGDGLPGDPNAIGGEVAEVTPGESGEVVQFGEPEAGRLWVGCIVETATDSRIGDIPGTGPQSTVWPTVRANVALHYGSYFGKSERINSKYHDIFRSNTSLTITGCFIQVQPGSVCKIFPVSTLKCPENPCGT